MDKINNANEQKNTAKKGFGSMPYEKIEKIASKGGRMSAAKAGPEGMAERGSKGGRISATRAGYEGMAARGSKGGQISAAKAGYEGMAERGRKGGYASAESKQRRAKEKEKLQQEAQLS
jgi:hypothetical protein